MRYFTVKRLAPAYSCQVRGVIQRHHVQNKIRLPEDEREKESE